MPITATDWLRVMYNLLVERGHEYDRNQFSNAYWDLTDQYERAKSEYRRLKAYGTN